MVRGKTLVVAAVFAAGVVACKQQASFNTTEEQRKTVHDNVTLLANKYRAENKLDGVDLYIRGDSTIANDCPQGDGWASVDLVDPKDHHVVQKLKCSTISEGIGCMTVEDFKTKRYAQEEDHCNSQVPFPIPKIGH